MAMDKKLLNKNHYKGSFNWYGEKYEYYGWAFSEEQALSYFCRRLSREVDRVVEGVYGYYTEGSGSYHIGLILSEPDDKGKVWKKEQKTISEITKGDYCSLHEVSAKLNQPKRVVMELVRSLGMTTGQLFGSYTIFTTEQVEQLARQMGG